MCRISCLLILLLSLSVGAKENQEEAASTAQPLVEKAARSSSRDVKLPRALVHQLEVEYRAFLSKNEVLNKDEIKRALLNISAELTQRNPVALHESVRIVTPLGGGVVDLNDFVTPLRGAFALKLNVKKEDGSEPDDLRMFYISHAKKRVVGGEEYGAGCGKYMEITSYYHKKVSRNGFELYTADQRYLSVLGGTFLAVHFAKEGLFVASMTFVDSRYPELLCE